MVMNEVVGDEDIFNLLGSPKTERWVEITQRLAAAMVKDLTADGVRKHVEKLDKEYRSKRSKERVMSGCELNKSSDEKELDRLMEVYLQKKDDETLVHTKRTESKTKKLKEDRAKGLAIRKAALSTETHNKKRDKSSKVPSAFEFLERPEKRAESRREYELERLRTERVESEKREQRREDQAAQQATSQLQATELIAKVLQTFTLVLPQQNS